MNHRVLFVLAVAALATGCGGPSAGTFDRDLHFPSPSPGPACPLLALSGPALNIPAPGSTGILTTISVLTFAPIAAAGQSISGSATLSGSDGSTIVSGPLTRSSDGTATVATIGGLQPHVTYDVRVSGRLLDGLCSIPFAADDGSFTTL